jgi:hypothetical protein
MLASRSKTSPSMQEDVQVEVCLDSKDTIFSIMVQNRSTLQSVMAVPKNDKRPGNRNRHLKQHRYTQANGTPVAMDQDDDDTSCRRQFDLMRNLSPIKNDRSSLFRGSGGDDNNQHKNRRHAQSVPPQHSRSPRGNESTKHREKRDASCIPSFERGSATNAINLINSQTVTRSKWNVNKLINNKPIRPAPTIVRYTANKPDLVSNVASRGGFFHSMRPGIRKIQDSAK